MSFPALQLATRFRRIALLLARMANLQYRVYQLDAEFQKCMANSQVALPYTYLMAWFILHFPLLMDPHKIADVPFIRWLEELN